MASEKKIIGDGKKDIELGQLTARKFEKILIRKGFQITENIAEVCNHFKTEMICYLQECSCCKDEKWLLKHNQSKYLIWYKYRGCKKDIEGLLGNIDCGGHWNNVFVFNVDKKRHSKINFDHDFSMMYKNLNPNDLILNEDEIKEIKKKKEDE